MKRPISITLTILSLPLVLGLFRLCPPASTTDGPQPALQGEAAINHLKEQGLYDSSDSRQYNSHACGSSRDVTDGDSRVRFL